MADLRTFSQTANTKITKLLTKKQIARLGEIKLQQRGPLAVLDPVIAAKLNIEDDVLAEMQQIQNQGRQAQRDAGRAQRQTGPSFQTADGQFDREAAQAYRDSPEGKAAAAQQQQERDQFQNQIIAQVGKLMTKGQKAKFLAMQGKEFDLSKLNIDPNAPHRPPASPPTAAGQDGGRYQQVDHHDRQGDDAAKKKTTAKRSTRRLDHVI